MSDQPPTDQPAAPSSLEAAFAAAAAMARLLEPLEPAARARVLLIVALELDLLTTPELEALLEQARPR